MTTAAFATAAAATAAIFAGMAVRAIINSYQHHYGKAPIDTRIHTRMPNW